MKKNALTALGMVLTIGILLVGCGNSSASEGSVTTVNGYAEERQGAASQTETVGTVYYSEPSRIILFYEDAEIPAAYTPVGYFDYSEAFLEAVRNNPVLEGWGTELL